MNPLKYQDNSDNHLLLFNDPLQRRRYACSLIMILLMTGVAEILHEKEIIFPEIAALIIGMWIVDMVSCTYAIGRLDFPDFFHLGKRGVIL